MSGDAVISASFSGTLGRFALDATFEAPMRGVTALFGPSGCGKTTVLRCIAGLSSLSGRLVVGGEVWQDASSGTFRPPYERPIGYVFQEASLFPHLSVRDNLLYGFRRALRAGASEKTRLDDVVALLGLGHLLDRAPALLSGGERQRVAVGRALLSQPRLLLMDEPLSALDRMTKEEILPYFEALHENLSMPVLYVSHDIGEVERLADNLVLLDLGRVVASAPLADILADSRLPIARAPTAATVIGARVAAFDFQDGLTTLQIDGGTLLVPGQIGEAGSFRRIRIAAEDVSLAADRPSRTTILNVLAARIRAIDPVGAAQANVVVTLGEHGQGARLLARITRRSLGALGLTPGQLVHAQVKAVSIVDPRRTAMLQEGPTPVAEPAGANADRSSVSPVGSMRWPEERAHA